MEFKNGVVAVKDVKAAITTLVPQVLDSFYFAPYPSFLTPNIEALSAVNHYTLRMRGRRVELRNFFRLVAINARFHGPVV